MYVAVSLLAIMAGFVSIGSVALASPSNNAVPFWLDPPGSNVYAQLKPKWYSKIQVNANTSFVSKSTTTNGNPKHIEVNWSDKGGTVEVR